MALWIAFSLMSTLRANRAIVTATVRLSGSVFLFDIAKPFKTCERPRQWLDALLPRRCTVLKDRPLLAIYAARMGRA
jgi:hypothetical protein